MLSFLNEEFEKVGFFSDILEEMFTDHVLYQAEEELTLAFYNCHIEAHSNQECAILPFFLPVNV